MAEIRLAGAPNFRDFGTPLVPGLLYRAELLNRLTADDLTTLHSLNINAVCDLRSAAERARHQNLWPQGQTPAQIGPVLGPGMEAVQPQGLRERLLGPDFDPGEAAALLHSGYAQMPAALAPSLRAIFTHLLETGSPVLIHCTSGKDRSGFTAAMVLFALGAPQDAIMADYLLSRTRSNMVRIHAMLRNNLGPALTEPRLQQLAGLTKVCPAYLQSAFAAAIAAYGSLEAYLHEAAGLSPALRGNLQIMAQNFPTGGTSRQSRHA